MVSLVTNHTYFNAKTLITGIDYSILCKNGFYDTNNQKGYFRDDAIINYDGKIINGDSIFFENEKSYASASYNIKINDTINTCVEAWRKNKCLQYSISHNKSYSIKDLAKMFKTKLIEIQYNKSEDKFGWRYLVSSK